ncbi:hypothetical protein M5D96_013331, partial [Drosophila gunungcola]
MTVCHAPRLAFGPNAHSPLYRFGPSLANPNIPLPFYLFCSIFKQLCFFAP